MKKILLSIPLFAILALWPSFLFGQAPGGAGDSRKFRLSPVAQVSSPNNPTMDGRRLTIDLLIDGQLPRMGGGRLGRLGIRLTRSSPSIWVKRKESE